MGKTYDTNDFTNVYHLVKHEENRSADDFFQRSTMSVILVRLLQAAQFFSDKPQKQISSTEKLVAGVILHNLQTLQFNAHEIAELQYDEKHPGDVLHAKSKFIGKKVFTIGTIYVHKIYFSTEVNLQYVMIF